MISEYISGLQHIGLPARELNRTIRFYEGLGFREVHRTATPAGVPVVFLQLGSCVLECWEEPSSAGRAGAIDHIALDVRDVERLYGEVCAAGYPITTDGIEALPFWERGVRFFKTQGPDGESVEFCEILRGDRTKENE